MFVIYMIFAALDVDEIGLPETIGFFIFQPLFGIILVAITIFTCIILGLPIRLHERLNNWWQAHQAIPIAGIIAGIILLTASLFPSLMEQKQGIIDGSSVAKFVPNLRLAVGGWVLTSFSLMHWFPKPLMNLLRRLL